MKQIITFLTLIIGFSSVAQQSYEDIHFEDETRNYYKYLPTGFDSNTESLPLVIFLHGIGGTALQLSTLGYNQTSDTARFIPVYLQGETNFQGQASWNNGTLLATNNNDILFISRVIDSMKADHNIDLTRVYMTGISMGSIMTYKAIRHLDNRIAAVSCHIGTMSTEEITGYNPTFPIPVQHVHGTADGTVPYDDNALPSLSLVPETIDKLKIINGWNGDSTITNIPDIVADGITIEKIVYDCTTPLELWKMNNADHIYLFPNNNDTSGIFISWYFFKRFTHPNPIAASIKDNNTVENIEFFPNPAADKIFIKHYHTLRNISVFNINGQEMMNLRKFDELLDISHLTTGLYIIQFTTLDGKISKDKLVVE
jgi:polyhydroxybutyrate depolymerase